MAGPGSSSKVTMVEVARKGGVSVGTVSRVINNDAHVAPETRERVTKLMREMGYVANRQARSLRGGKTNVIGVLVPNLGTGYIDEIMHGIDNELALAQLDLMLFTTHRTAIKETNYIANPVQGSWPNQAADRINYPWLYPVSKTQGRLTIRGDRPCCVELVTQKEYQHKKITPYNPLHAIVNNSFVIR